MKIAFPTEQDNGLKSQVYGHFGSAGYFIIVDTDSDAHEVISNSNRVHEHGQCQPLAALGQNTVDAVVVGGIGAGALYKLNSGGVKVYRAVEGSVRENLSLIKSGNLPIFDPGQTCQGHHSHGGSCGH